MFKSPSALSSNTCRTLLCPDTHTPSLILRVRAGFKLVNWSLFPSLLDGKGDFLFSYFHEERALRPRKTGFYGAELTVYLPELLFTKNKKQTKPPQDYEVEKEAILFNY